MTNVFNAQSQALYAQGNPPFTEITRQGVAYNFITATAFTPLVVVPSTLAQVILYNNMTGPSALTLVIDSIFAFQLLSTAAVQTYGIWAQVTPPIALPVNTALSVFSQSGKPFYTTTTTSKVVTAVNISSGFAANGWRPYGPVAPFSLAAATPGSSFEAPINGRLIVPPGCGCCAHVVGSVATASSFQMGVSWHELALVNVP